MERPTIPIYDAATLTAEARAALAHARERFHALESATPSLEVLDEWDRINIFLEDVIGPASILGSVHPDKAVRDAADDVLLEATTFSTELFQNRQLFEVINAVEGQSEATKQYRKDLLEGFEDSGVALDEERRDRVRAIFDEIEKLNQEFDRRLRDNTETITFSPDEFKGLPESYLSRAKRDDEGNIVMSFDYPDYIPFMANAESESARQRYYAGYMTRGGDENLELLDQIVTLRRELAALYDLPSYAHYVTRRQMVEQPDVVRNFLREVQNAVRQAEIIDLEELRQLKAAMLDVPVENAKIERWDQSFFSERLRQKKFAIDQEELRKFFPTQPTVDWVLHITRQLYGVRFERAEVPVWHEDVVYYDVFEEEDGSFVGGIYIDLYPREGKYKHAAAWGVRGVSRKFNRTPISALVCNFDRVGLTHGELETLFHEFGHALHGVLSQTEYNAHAGTSVERDFVEAPSQMYEEWARKFESLETLREISPDSPAIDREIVERLGASRRFGRGLNYARQLLYARFDMELAGAEPRPSIELWREMEGPTPMGHVGGTAFPATFSHIAGDYAAGYYGYMWSEVLALDMLSAFENNIMSPEVGRRFRRTVLARGGEQPARLMVQNFLGRDVSSEAFFKEITGRR